MEFFLGGTSAVVAGVFSNPFDVMKTRQQLRGELTSKAEMKKSQYENIYKAMITIVRTEGIAGLQKGLSAQLAFQFVMNCFRLGTYQTLEDLGWNRNKNGQLSPIRCLACGAFSGFIGVTVASPFYMIKTQIQAQAVGKYIIGHQRQHKGLADALITTFRDRGVKGLWQGYTAFVPRNLVNSAVQLACFSNCKHYFERFELFSESVFYTAAVSSIITGFVACCFMTPFDTSATRMFVQPLDANGKGIYYKNVFDCFTQIYKKEGLHGFYKGFGVSYMRMAPHNLLHLTLWDLFKKWHKESRTNQSKR
ncbi:unnamed protein product [Diamesa serratosioi]